MKRTFFLAAIIIAAVAAPASALFGPMPVTDVFGLPKWVQQITNQEMQIAQGVHMVQADTANLQRLATAPTFQNAESEVNAVSATGQQLAAEYRGTMAAGAVVTDASEEAAEAARLNGLAQIAQGATQQAQVSNAYEAQTVNLLEQGNVLNAQVQLQHAGELK
ncbi:MAG: hypothetical protein ACLPYS_11725, partial [Vulcanimicrobiaceae bacterium]